MPDEYVGKDCISIECDICYITLAAKFKGH